MCYFESGLGGALILSAKPFAFVLMPFDSEFDDIYRLGIQAVAAECDVVAERVDEQSFSETILDRIYRQIEAADFIIADMTGRNPNVFYEVGYAHARDKLCTLLTQTADDIPFDLKHHRHIVYGTSISALKKKLAVEIAWLKAEFEKRKTNAFTIELKSANGELKVNDYVAYAQVKLSFDITNMTKKKSPDIDAIYLHTGDGWEFTQSGDNCPSSVSDNDKKNLRHFIKSPVPRLSPGGWAQLNVEGSKRVWAKWKGDELKEKYDMNGYLVVEILTPDGTFSQQIVVEVECEEIPF